MPELVKEQGVIGGNLIARYSIEEALDELHDGDRLMSERSHKREDIERVLKNAYPEGYLYSWEIVRLAYKLGMNDYSKWLLDSTMEDIAAEALTDLDSLTED